jgi:hypothetical protein
LDKVENSTSSFNFLSLIRKFLNDWNPKIYFNLGKWWLEATFQSVQIRKDFWKNFRESNPCLQCIRSSHYAISAFFFFFFFKNKSDSTAKGTFRMIIKLKIKWFLIWSLILSNIGELSMCWIRIVNMSVAKWQKS